MKSIRRRLLELLLLAGLAIWLVLAALLYASAEREVVEVLDSELAQYARVLQALAAAREDSGPQARRKPLEVGTYLELRPDEGHHYERKLRFQIWAGDGELLLHSSDASRADPTPTRGGYGVEPGPDFQWRTFTLVSGPGDLRVRVAERADVRDEMVAEIVLNQLAPGLLMLPISAMLIWSVVGRGLEPLRLVADEVARRSADHLHPLLRPQVPAEVQPLVDAINRLFERLRGAFERERRFIADAAHELRTPLAAIKAQAQAAIGADDPARRRHALENIVRGVDRAAHLEAQLLTLARLDPEARGARRLLDVGVDLARVARQVLSELAPSAIARNVELSLEGDDPAHLHADPDLLAILLRNLVENSIRHTPAGGSVAVSLDCAPGVLVLTVADTGPGIPPEERERVFERFYRSDARGSGSGLGLSIVRRIADLHGATVRLDAAPGGGLLAEVRLARTLPSAARALHGLPSEQAR